jgi:hypothetical protein
MLHRVKQEHDTGCFVACTAILLQVSYSEAFNRLWPNRIMPPPENPWADISLSIEAALWLLPRVGLQLQKANIKSVKSLRKRTSLIILRWKCEPERSHAVVFDGESSRFIDPSYHPHLSYRLYNRNLDSIYYVKKLNNQEVKHDHMVS